MFNSIFNRTTVSSATNSLYATNTTNKEVEEEKFNPFDFNWADNKTGEERKEAKLKEKNGNPFKMALTASAEDVFELQKKQEQKTVQKKAEEKKTLNFLEKANEAVRNSNTNKNELNKIKERVATIQNSDIAKNKTVQEMMQSYKNGAKVSGAFNDDTPERMSELGDGKNEKSQQKTSTHHAHRKSGGGTFKGIRIAGGAVSYIGFIDHQKSWTDKSLNTAQKEQKTTKTTQVQKKQAPKTEQITPDAGNTDDLKNTKKGQSFSVGSAKTSSSSPQVETAKHSQGTAQALGKVNGSVEDIKSDFQKTDAKDSDKNYKDILSGVEEQRTNENQGISDFNNSKSNASMQEAEQERQAKRSDSATEKAMESEAEKQSAQEKIGSCNMQLQNAKAMTQEGNADIDAGQQAMEEAEDMADEAAELADDSKEAQAEGLKKLQESSNQMKKGTSLTKKGDALTATGQGLIHGGVPLTFSIFTVAIGVAMISTGLGLAASGKAKTNSGNNQVRKGQKSRQEGIKKFDEGTKKAQESKEKQAEAAAKNDEATELSDGGSAKVENATKEKQNVQSKKSDAEQAFSNADSKQKQFSMESLNSAKAASFSRGQVQTSLDKAQNSINTIVTAKTTAENLTGLKGKNSELSGVGAGNGTSINPNMKSSASSALGGLLSGVNAGKTLNLSDAMKGIVYKKGLDKKDKDKDKNKNKTNEAQKNKTVNEQKKSIFATNSQNQSLKKVSIFSK